MNIQFHISHIDLSDHLLCIFFILNNKSQEKAEPRKKQKSATLYRAKYAFICCRIGPTWTGTRACRRLEVSERVHRPYSSESALRPGSTKGLSVLELVRFSLLGFEWVRILVQPLTFCQMQPMPRCEWCGQHLAYFHGPSKHDERLYDLNRQQKTAATIAWWNARELIPNPHQLHFRVQCIGCPLGC